MNEALLLIKPVTQKNSYPKERLHKLKKKIERKLEIAKIEIFINEKIKEHYNGEMLFDSLNNIMKIERELEIFPTEKSGVIFRKIREYLIKEIKNELSGNITLNLSKTENPQSLRDKSLYYIDKDINLLKRIDPENPNLKDFNSKYDVKVKAYNRLIDSNSFACISRRYKKGCDAWCKDLLEKECDGPLDSFMPGEKCDSARIKEIVNGSCPRY